MSAGDMRPSPLIEQTLALDAYLDALLREVPSSNGAEETPRQIATHRALVPVAPPAAAPAPGERSRGSEIHAVPLWARARFQCLLFKTAGLTLGLPLLKLNGVLPWSDDVTTMPGAPRWLIGLRRYHGTNVKIVDTARLIVPENRHPASPGGPSARAGHVLLIDGARWGLSCDGIDATLTLEPAAVKWRAARGGRRPWLAGIILQPLCALLDADELARLLQSGGM